MEAHVEAFKSNPNTLKSLIFYDVIQKKPAFESYRDVCKVLGDDVMDFIEYEYWYYRIHAKKFEFDHDKSTELKQMTLPELPVEILSKISEHLDPMERSLFGATSKAIKKIVAIHRPVFEKISIEVDTDVRALYFTLNNRKTFHFLSLTPNNVPEYSAVVDRLKRVLETENVFFETFELNLPTFHCSLSMSKLLESLPRFVEARNLKIKANTKDFLAVVDHMKPGELERIHITDAAFFTEDLSPLLESEQFRVDELPKFFHLRSFKARFDSITPKALENICRGVWLNSDEFEKCEIRFLYDSGKLVYRYFGGDVDSYSAISKIVTRPKDILKIDIQSHLMHIEKVRPTRNAA